jgi:hypothetical protein
MPDHDTDLIVAPSEIDGWDVVREGDDVALTNHPTREEAEAAAKLRADEEHRQVTHESEPVQEGAGDQTRGVKLTFATLVGLLAAIVVLIVVIALVSSALNV